MRSLLLVGLMMCAIAASSRSFATGASFPQVPQTAVLEIPHMLLYVVDDDPTTLTRRLYFNGDDKLKVDLDSIICVVDPSERRGRVFVRFTACSEIPSELDKVRSWDWKHALKGRYRPKSDEETIRPAVSVTIMFQSEAQLRKYEFGDDWPELPPANVHVLGRVIYAPNGFPEPTSTVTEDDRVR